jgi:hypothetical protein
MTRRWSGPRRRYNAAVALVPLNYRTPKRPAMEGRRDWLAEFLGDRHERCPLCAADLRGVSGGVCPGCGRELVLTLGVADAYLRAWITAAVAMSVSAGVGVLVLIIVGNEGLPRPRRVGDYWLTGAIWYFMLSVPVAAVVLMVRRRFMRLERRTQWLLASAAAAATALGFIAFAVGFALL